MGSPVYPPSKGKSQQEKIRGHRCYFQSLYALAITSPYSPSPTGKVPSGAGDYLAYNGNQPVYRYKNQKGIAPDRQNTPVF